MTERVVEALPPLEFPAVPPALRRFLLSCFRESELARRALHAPLPHQGFRSAFEMQELWRGGGDAVLRQDVEAEINEPLYWPAEILRSTREPFFVAPGTTGTLRSPYPEIPDAIYWLLAQLHGPDPEIVRQAFEAPAPIYGGVCLRELARRSASAGVLQRLWDRVRGQPDWRDLAYSVARRVVTGDFAD